MNKPMGSPFVRVVSSALGGAYVLACLIPFLIMAGCTEKPETPPTPVATPEPTPEQIASQIRSSLAPLQAPLQGLGPFQTDLKDSMLAALRAAKGQNAHTKNGEAALTQITHEVEDIIHRARAENRWPLVLASIEAYEVLAPGDTRMAKLKELATLEVNKPHVSLRGWWVDKEGGEHIYAFLDITDPNTHQTHSVRVREGDEFDNLRFVKIIGNQSGVQLEYLPIPGELFEVKLSS